MTVFVYHARDSEGRLLAAVIQQLDTNRTFRYLSIDEPVTWRRMQRLVHRHGLEHLVPPFIVVCRDLTGTATDTHTILYGDDMGAWFQGLLTNAMQQDGMAATLRELLLTGLSTPTITLIGHCLRLPSAVPHAAAPESSDVPPPPQAQANQPTNLPPPPTKRAPLSSTTIRHAQPAVARSAVVRTAPAGHERLPESEGTVFWGKVNDPGDAWTAEATVPEARHNKTVNIADAMSHAKQRDIQQPRLR